MQDPTPQTEPKVPEPEIRPVPGREFEPARSPEVTPPPGREFERGNPQPEVLPDSAPDASPPAQPPEVPPVH